MPSRRNPGILDVLLESFLLLPWWVGPLVSGSVYTVMRLCGGALEAGGFPTGKPIGGLLGTIAPAVALLVLFVWLVSLVQKAYRRHLLASQKGIDSIRSLSWREFEYLVAEALRRDGYTVEERGGSGRDGGIDLVARRREETMLVQCKQWKTWDVGVKVVREMYGVMHADKATSVMIVSTGKYTRAARAFAEGKPIQLMDGPALAEFVSSLQGSKAPAAVVPSSAETAREEPTEPPATCPKCGAPMVVRTARKGMNLGQQFLGCSTFPKCSGTRDLPSAT